uniref:Rad4/PNGase transglutaminase-like fold domain-containing protein n=1 Tax=Oryza barthii TaxID=65489 RepID=A0A0D3GR95_9ORYZ
MFFQGVSYCLAEGNCSRRRPPPPPPEEKTTSEGALVSSGGPANEWPSRRRGSRAEPVGRGHGYINSRYVHGEWGIGLCLDEELCREQVAARVEEFMEGGGDRGDGSRSPFSRRVRGNLVSSSRVLIFSLTSIPPELQKIVVEADGSVVGDGTDLEAISEGLRLVVITGEEEEGEAAAAAEAARAQEKSDEELARMIQAEEEALLLQQYSIRNDGGEEFRERVEPYMHQVLMYEDPMRQEAARKTVPMDELQEKALVSLAKEGNFSPSKDEEDHAFLLQLLFWFKQSFRWVNAPPCDSCGRETFNVGMGTALPSEIKFGANRVEIYRCNYCTSTTRFPRYNDPYKKLGKDAVENGPIALHSTVEVLDMKLVWWNKKLDYVIAISKDGVRDVTKRYTRKWHEVLSRRIITSEDTVSAILSSITGKYRSGLSIDGLTAIENRDKKESEELSKAAYLEVDTSISLPGRQSGSVEWRKARVMRFAQKVTNSQEAIDSVQATAAFDGIRSSKWEEPDGAKGCWIIYRMLDGQTCELDSYDLMSANDVPERDPMDWVLEGSTDGGSTWNTIDARSSVIFDSRFYRKTFTVDKRYKANAFRFRFLRVRESNGNPRFQIGSIDLYGKST